MAKETVIDWFKLIENGSDPAEKLENPVSKLGKKDITIKFESKLENIKRYYENNCKPEDLPLDFYEKAQEKLFETLDSLQEKEKGHRIKVIDKDGKTIYDSHDKKLNKDASGKYIKASDFLKEMEKNKTIEKHEEYIDQTNDLIEQAEKNVDLKRIPILKGLQKNSELSLDKADRAKLKDARLKSFTNSELKEYQTKLGNKLSNILGNDEKLNKMAELKYLKQNHPDLYKEAKQLAVEKAAYEKCRIDLEKSNDNELKNTLNKSPHLTEEMVKCNEYLSKREETHKTKITELKKDPKVQTGINEIKDSIKSQVSMNNLRDKQDQIKKTIQERERKKNTQDRQR